MELSKRRNPPGPMPQSRAITGPTPHAVGILERPKLKRPAEWRILERIKKENMRDESTAFVVYHDTNHLKNLFLERTDKKILHNTIERKVGALMMQHQHSLEERRERLRHLIASEEEMYFTEMASKAETLLERQARMRERARSLREKREQERVAEAERRLEQRWRNQCEELRGHKFKNNLAEVTRNRGEQLRLKEEEKKRKEKEEQLYADMWKEDWAVKCKREDMEAALQIERNKEMVDILDVQVASKEQEKLDEKTLKSKEAELMREEAALRAVEEIKLKEDKRRRQLEAKTGLDLSLKLKMKKRAKEVQEELAFDMKLLEQMLQETSNESQENLQRKKQLKEEVRIYRQHLQEQAEEERRQERELDAVVTAEVEKQWSRRVEQWQRESNARKQLLSDVLQIRKEQVQEKLDQLSLEKAEVEKERIQVLKNLKEHRALEQQQEEDKLKTKRIYGRNLLQQMDYLEHAKKSERQQVKDDWALCLEAEAEYQKKVKEALKKPTPEKIHPTKLLLTGKALLI